METVVNFNIAPYLLRIPYIYLQQKKTKATKSNCTAPYRTGNYQIIFYYFFVQCMLNTYGSNCDDRFTNK